MSASLVLAFLIGGPVVALADDNGSGNGDYVSASGPDQSQAVSNNQVLSITCDQGSGYCTSVDTSQTTNSTAAQTATDQNPYGNVSGM